MSAKRIIRLSDRTRSPSPNSSGPAQRRFKTDDHSPTVPSIRSRLGGFVKESPGADGDGVRDKRQYSFESKHDSAQYSSEQYGPRPPSGHSISLRVTNNSLQTPLYSSVTVKQNNTAEESNVREPVAVKRSVITGPNERDSNCSNRRLKTESHEASGGSHNKTVNIGDDRSRLRLRNSIDVSGTKRLQNQMTTNLQRKTPPVNELLEAISAESAFAIEKNTATTTTDLKRTKLGQISVRHSDTVQSQTNALEIDIDTPLTCGLIDTHMHIDFTLDAFRQHAGTSWAVFCKRYATRFPACFEGAIAIFCQPDSFKCSSEMLDEAFRSDKLWMAFGVHPHFADQYSEDNLRACLHKFKSKIVALGEIGLDTSSKNHVTLEVQKEVFRSQAEIAIECKLPLVIHSRIANGNAEALAFMRQFVPRDYPIHRHCFTGKFDEANEWMSHFRNCYIGFTPLINTQRDLIEVVKRIPLDRILLETDAPYFKTGLPPLQGGERPLGTVPGDVIYTAAGIAKAKNLPIEAIICQTRLNAKAIYGI